jgi:hypothetical protein
MVQTGLGQQTALGRRVGGALLGPEKREGGSSKEAEGGGWIHNVQQQQQNRRRRPGVALLMPPTSFLAEPDAEKPSRRGPLDELTSRKLNAWDSPAPVENGRLLYKVGHTMISFSPSATKQAMLGMLTAPRAAAAVTVTFFSLLPPCTNPGPRLYPTKVPSHARLGAGPWVLLATACPTHTHGMLDATRTARTHSNQATHRPRISAPEHDAAAPRRHSTTKARERHSPRPRHAQPGKAPRKEAAQKATRRLSANCPSPLLLPVRHPQPGRWKPAVRPFARNSAPNRMPHLLAIMAKHQNGARPHPHLVHMHEARNQACNCHSGVHLHAHLPLHARAHPHPCRSRYIG